MRIIDFSPEIADAWNDCCDASDQAWLFHRAEWLGIEQAFLMPANHSFAIVSGERVVGVQPLYQTAGGLGAWIETVVHSGFHRHTGLALRPDLEPHEAKAARSLAMRRIEEVASKIDADRIQLNVQNLTPESFTTQRQEIPFWMHGYGFHLGLNFSPTGVVPVPGMSICVADQVVDLRPPEDALFAGLDESARRAVRKATGGGLTHEMITEFTPDTLEAYYTLALASAARTGEALASRDYFARLFDVLGRQQRLVLILCRVEGVNVAAVLLGIEKGAASYMGGISDPAYLHLRVNDYAHWTAILSARQLGLHWYRLGPIFPEAGEEWPIARVSRFKSKFGGRSFTTIQGSKFLKPAKYLAGGADQLALMATPDVTV
jgi:hypothetical protein